MGIMAMEFNQLLFPKRWPLRWGLREAFTYFRTHAYKGPPYDDGYKFHDSFYLITHIAFAVSAYSAIKMNTKDVPWLFDYCRRSCRYWVQMADRRLSGKEPEQLVDIDGLAEAVDVMRGCGLTDGGDRLLCSSALTLLAFQRPDGSWPYWILAGGAADRKGEKDRGPLAREPKEASHYNMVHPTWTAVQSLRDRNFEYDRKGNAQWAQYMDKLLKQTNLRKLDVRIVYEKKRKKSKASLLEDRAKVKETTDSVSTSASSASPS